MRNTPAATLLPFVSLSPDHQSCEEACTYFRSGNVPTGADGALLICLDQVEGMMVAEAVRHLVQEALTYIAVAEHAKLLVAQARRVVAEQFADCPLLMRVNEIGLICEDGDTQLIADFWMLDDRLELSRHRRVAPDAAGLNSALQDAYRWHAYRAAVQEEQHAKRCDLLMDACAEAAIAWAGLELADILEELKVEPWVNVDLRNQNSLVAKAMIYIGDGVLTAHIEGRNDSWRLQGTELIARESLSCVECLRNSGMRSLPAETLANIVSARECAQSGPNQMRTDEAHRIDPELSYRAVFFEEKVARKAA